MIGLNAMIEEKLQREPISKASPFAIRGAVEGFYGTFYTFPQRNDLIRFMGEQGFNLYLYGPKFDRHHRRNWRDPYPPQQMEQFAETVAVARGAGVAFGYALSPGHSIGFGSARDFALLKDKLYALYEIGVRVFSLFLDDIVPQFYDMDDTIRYANYAEAQADLCNRTYAWLQALDQSCTLSMCPTEYHGAPPFGEYLHQLGACLHPEIDVFYTGPTICSRIIGEADAAAFGRAVRRPPLIWDNYPVNDLGMQREMHIGPIRGRGSSLCESVRGVLVNLMSQAEATKVPLHTYGAYFRAPAAYDAERAWNDALCAVAGEKSVEALRRLGENSLHCCLGTAEAAALARLTQPVLEAMQNDAVDPAVMDGEGLNQQSATHVRAAMRDLDTYLQNLEEACYHINYYMPNLALRQDLLPWTEGLHLQQDMGRRALALWQAETPPHAGEWSVHRLQELVAEVSNHPKRIGSALLLPLARLALQRVQEAHEVETVNS